MAGQIFISYSKKDKDFAWKLADDLVNAGHKVWIDRSLQVGEDWKQTIIKKLEETDEVIVILSSNAIASKWVQHEGSMAYGLKKKMYPVLIDALSAEELPLWTSEFQYHSFVNADYEPAFERLNAVLTPPNPIQDLLEQQVNAYKQTGELIGETILRVIDEAHESLILDAPAQELIEKSQLAIKERQNREKQLIEQKELARQNELEKAQQLVNTQRQRTIVLAAGLLVAIVLGIFSISLLRQSNQNLFDAQAANTQSAANAATAQAEKERAERQAQIALSRQLSAQAISLIRADRDFELTLLLALESNYLAENKNLPEARDALRQALNFAPQRTIRMLGDIGSTALHPDMPIVAAISQSTVFLFDLSADHDEKVLLKDKPVREVLFSPNGSRLLAAVGGNYAYLWNGTTYHPIEILDHSESIISAKFSSDSRMIITQGKTSIRIWNANSGTLVLKLQTGALSSYALSNNSELLVTLREDDIMQVWDTLKGTNISSFKDENKVIDYVFSADDRFVITSNQDQRIYFWNAYDFTIAKILEQTRSVTNLEVDPSGKYLAASYDDPNNWNQGEIWIWDIEHQAVKVHRTYPEKILEFRFDGAGNYFTIANWGGTVEILNLPLGTGTKFNSRAPVFQLLFSPDNLLLLISNIDGTTYIVNTETGTEQAKLRNADYLLDVFINQRNLVVSESYDRTIRFWDINNFKIPKTLEIKGGVTNILFNPANSQQFVIGSESGIVQLWFIGDSESQLTYSHLSPIKDMQFSPSGEYLASLDSSGTLYLTLISNKSNLKQIENVSNFVFSPDGKWFLTTINNQLIINNLYTSISPISLDFSNNIDRILFSPDGTYLITAGKTEASMYLFNDLLQYRGNELVPLINFQQREYFTPLFSYDMKWLATIDANDQVLVWNIQKREPIMTLQHNWLVDMKFSRDGLQFITAGCYDGIQVWETRNWEQVKISSNNYALCLYEFSISITGKKILSTYSDGNVRMLDISTGSMSIISYHKLIDPFFTIIASFSSSGDKVVTSGDDGIIRIIDADSEQTLDTIYAGDMIRDVLFSPDEKYIIASSQNEKIYIWESEINDLKDRACGILSRNLTQEEWSRFVGNDIPYTRTCPNLPSELEVKITPTPP